MPVILEMFNEFARRQGCPYIVAGRQVSHRTGEDVSRIVFENGAVSDGYSHFEPPTEPRVLREMRLEYLRAKLKKEEKDFNEFKSYCMEQATFHQEFPKTCPPPPRDAAEQLSAGALRIHSLREQIATLEKEGKNPILEEKKREEEERLRQRYEGFRSLCSQISNVSI